MAEGKLSQNGARIISQQKSARSERGTKLSDTLRRSKRHKGNQEELYKSFVEKRKKTSTRQSVGSGRRFFPCHSHSIDTADVSTAGVHMVMPCCCRTQVTIQEADPKTVQDHRVLSRVADTITTWDEITSLGLELSCNPYDVTRLRNENRSIKGAAYEILQSFYARNINSGKSVEAILKTAIIELGKGALVVNLGLEELNSDVT